MTMIRRRGCSGRQVFRTRLRGVGECDAGRGISFFPSSGAVSCLAKIIPHA